MTSQNSLNLVRQFYPDALTTSESVNRLLDTIKEHLSLEPHQIMHADSICSDDVNSIEYPKKAYEMLGPFNMGGLNGFPFTGLTGMNAFPHHVPEDGAVFVFYAPHIGISKQGTIGEIFRIGQNTPSTCCGAAKAALNKLLNNQITFGEITELDYQQNTIEQIFFRQKDRIIQATFPVKEATEVMFEAIDERINLLASKTKYPCKYLVLGGAILINGDHDMGSFASFRRFEIRNAETSEILNLIHKMAD